MGIMRLEYTSTVLDSSELIVARKAFNYFSHSKNLSAPPRTFAAMTTFMQKIKHISECERCDDECGIFKSTQVQQWQ